MSRQRQNENPTQTEANWTGALSAMGRRTEEPPIGWLMSLALKKPDLISLAAGFTDYDTLPVEEVKEIVLELLGDAGKARTALQYGTTAGLWSLRSLTAQRIADQDRAALRQMERRVPMPPAETWDPDRLVITNGSQQLLYLVSEALCDPGDIVLVEDPTYFVYLGIAQSFGIECRGIRTTPQGIDLHALDQVLDRIQRSGQAAWVKMVYLVTYYQNPTGWTTSAERKRGVWERIQAFEAQAGHPIYIVEDAAYRELGFGIESPPSFLVFPGAAERVVYAGTYSKPFATGIRIGFGLLPSELFQLVIRLKNNHDFGTSNFLQGILAEALERGWYDRHLQLLHSQYRKKAVAMQEALERWFPLQAVWEPPQGGLYFWVQLPEPLRTGPNEELFRAALDQGVLYVPGSYCYASDPTRAIPDHAMRLSFGNATLEQIEEGIRRLGRAIEKTWEKLASKNALTKGSTEQSE